MPAPIARPFFADAEWRNENPDLAQLTRRLMRWAAYEKERDLLWTPSDPQIPLLNGLCASSCTAGGGAVFLGTMIVPENNLPGTAVDVRFVVTRGSLTDAATLRLVIKSSGEQVEFELPSSQFGGQLTYRGFRTFYMPSAGFDGVDIYLVPSVGTVQLEALAAWWATSVAFWGRSGLSEPGAARLFAQAAYDATDADSTYHYRTLARACNAFSCGTPRMLCNKWFGTWRVTSASGTRLAEYAFVIPPGASSLEVRMHHRVTGGTASLDLALYDETSSMLGSSIATASYSAPVVTDIGQSVYSGGSATLTFTPAMTARRCALVITATQAAGHTIFLGAVAAWEGFPSATDIGIPSGERPSTPYGTFPALAEPTSGTPITKAQKVAIIQALQWVFTWRRRTLLSDSRYQVPDGTYGITKWQFQFSVNSGDRSVAFRTYRPSPDNGFLSLYSTSAPRPPARRTNHAFVLGAVSPGANGQMLSGAGSPPTVLLPETQFSAPPASSAFLANGYNPSTGAITVVSAGGTVMNVSNGDAWKVLYLGSVTYEQA